MNKNLLVLISLVLCAVFVSASTNENQSVAIKADYCVVFEVDENQTKKLMLDLDTFAAIYHLDVNKTSPVSIVYKDRLENDIIVLRILFGDFGSVLSHYSVRSDIESSSVLSKLKKFIQEQLENKYVFRKCSEIENFKIPEFISQS